uniref:Uncharacterized protein MANES_04G075400 n=1 Tax=Rhizophora mucronata TaxID=61149 RepID=A0A2P2JKE5_RHIMU
MPTSSKTIALPCQFILYLSIRFCLTRIYIHGMSLADPLTGTCQNNCMRAWFLLSVLKIPEMLPAMWTRLLAILAVRMAIPMLRLALLLSGNCRIPAV